MIVLELCVAMPPRNRPQRPNCFFSLRVNNVGILKQVKKLQKKLAKHYPSLAPCMINPDKMHITLMVTHLANDRDVKSATDLLTNIVNSRHDGPMAITFDGFRMFDKGVLFAKPSDESAAALRRLAEEIYVSLNHEHLATQTFRFDPHMTICDLSKGQAGLEIEPAELKNFMIKHAEFKTERQTFKGVELLSLSKQDADPSGYYGRMAYVRFWPCVFARTALQTNDPSRIAEQ